VIYIIASTSEYVWEGEYEPDAEYTGRWAGDNGIKHLLKLNPSKLQKIQNMLEL